MSYEENERNNLSQEGFLALSCEELEEKRDLHKDRVRLLFGNCWILYGLCVHV